MRLSRLYGPFSAITLGTLSLCAASATPENLPSTATSSCTHPFCKGFTDVAKKAIPAVVYIQVQGKEMGIDETLTTNPYGSPFDQFSDELFQRFFGQPPRDQQGSEVISRGSGFFVSPEGYIMTNCHVIKGASKITVTLNNGDQLPATLVGADSHTDIGIIKVEKVNGKDFSFLPFGNSDTLEVGEWAAAIGNPFQLRATLTVGVISAKGRDLQLNDLEDFIQTDAAINPGNSGGPLVNLNGEVVGINTVIASISGGYLGIGFAVPSNMAKVIMTQLIEHGTVVRGFIGVSLQPINKEMATALGLSLPEGVLVAEVVPGSPAEAAGLKTGDVLLESNGHPISTLASLRKEIALMNPGSLLQLRVKRQTEMLDIAITIGSQGEHLVKENLLQQLGFDVETATPPLLQRFGYAENEQGVIISKVRSRSPAGQAGLKVGFLIVSINDGHTEHKVSSAEDFQKILSQSEKGKSVLLLVKEGPRRMRFYTLKLD